MQVIEFKNDNIHFEAKVVIPSSKIANKIQKELTNLTKKVKIDGFRVGKTPPQVIEKKYKDSVKLDVVQGEISDAIKQLVKDHNLKILGDPKLDNLQNEEDKDLEFILKFELLPTIILPDFKNIIITRPKLIVTEEEIDEQLNKLKILAKKYVHENLGAAEKGQQVTIDAIGYIDEKAFEGGKITDYKLVLGSKSFIDNFEDQLIGYKAGEEIEVNVTFPNNYHLKEIAGKPAKFIVQIKAIHSAEEVTINDEFAKDFNSDTLEELRNRIVKSIEKETFEVTNNIMKVSLFDKLEEILIFNVPKSLVEQEINTLKSKIEKNNSPSAILKNKSEEKLKDYYKKLALRRIKVGLILAEYMKIKELSLNHEEIIKAITSEAENFPGQEQIIFDFYKKSPKALEPLKGPLLEEKAVQHIFNNEVILEEKEYTRTELSEFIAQQEKRMI